MEKKHIYAILALIIVTIIVFVVDKTQKSSSNVLNEKEQMKEGESKSNSYKNINWAFDDHDIYYGMSAADVRELIGEPDKVVYESGNIVAWWYNDRIVRAPIRFDYNTWEVIAY